jgi:hypothetical protein
MTISGRTVGIPACLAKQLNHETPKPLKYQELQKLTIEGTENSVYVFR